MDSHGYGVGVGLWAIFLSGLVFGAALSPVGHYLVKRMNCPKLDCSGQLYELHNTLRARDAEIKSLGQYKKAVEWGKVRK